MGQGKEAATVRQAFLVVVLVGAAFLGGAFVNGPGLQWAQTRLLRTLGLNNGGEIDAVDLTSNPSNETLTDMKVLSKSADGLSSGSDTRQPSAVTQNNSPKQDAFERPSATQPRRMSSTADLGLEQFHPSSLPSAKSTGSVTKSSEHRPAPLDSQLKQVATQAAQDLASAEERANTHTAPALLNSLAGLLSTNDSSSDSPAPQVIRLSSGKKPAVGNSNEWVLLESRMQTLGVSRFTVEGEPGRCVVFACLIPLAGREAVTQRFEAEGEDMIQAAHAALRRLVLWRATQLPQEDGLPITEKNNR
jgi:hypothetical protein